MDDEMKIYACEWAACEQSFATQQALVEHVNVHLADQRLANNASGVFHVHCQWRGCERGDQFFTLQYMPQHCRLHTGEKPVQCRYCNRSFRRADHRTNHERAKHIRVRPLRCPVPGCTLGFVDSSGRRRHIQKMHPGVALPQNWKHTRVLHSTSPTRVVLHDDDIPNGAINTRRNKKLNNNNCDRYSPLPLCDDDKLLTNNTYVCKSVDRSTSTTNKNRGTADRYYSTNPRSSSSKRLLPKSSPMTSVPLVNGSTSARYPTTISETTKKSTSPYPDAETIISRWFPEFHQTSAFQPEPTDYAATSNSLATAVRSGCEYFCVSAIAKVSSNDSLSISSYLKLQAAATAANDANSAAADYSTSYLLTSSCSRTAYSSSRDDVDCDDVITTTALTNARVVCRPLFGVRASMPPTPAIAAQISTRRHYNRAVNKAAKIKPVEYDSWQIAIFRDAVKTYGWYQGWNYENLAKKVALDERLVAMWFTSTRKRCKDIIMNHTKK